MFFKIYFKLLDSNAGNIENSKNKKAILLISTFDIWRCVDFYYCRCVGLTYNVAVNIWTSCSFYSASALLAMQSAVLDRGILSVRHSVTFRYCVQTNEDTIVRFPASGRTIHLISEEIKFVGIFAPFSR